ncbi:hypothetical protein SK128_005974 [Halocaridina rubra]|uniref:Uncharacterized protein n=1 Tax=Halocaridina rubra TaxID=373956 RepID=A0AAN8WY85_HALRR
MDHNTTVSPLWTRYDSSEGISCFGRLDYLNNGPVVNIYGGEDRQIFQETQGHRNLFCMSKDIGRKFPLEKAMEFMYPVTNPRFVFVSRNSLIKRHTFLGRHYANSMDSFVMQGKTYVLNIRNSVDIVVSEVRSRTFNDVQNSSSDPLLSTLSTYSVIPKMKCTRSNAVEVIGKEINGRAYILVRSGKGMRFATLDENLQCRNAESSQFFQVREEVTSMAMSETLPGCLALTSSNGCVSMYEYPDKAPIWQCNFQGEFGSQKTAYKCTFGRHAFPFLIVNDNSTVWFCDTRCPQKDITTLSDKVAFTLKAFRSYIPDSDIICNVSRSRGPHLFVVTSSSVVLIDERYSKVPLRKWGHMMWNQPSFAKSTLLNNCEILMLSSRTDMKVCAISREFSEISNNTNSQTCLPRHFSLCRDTVQFAQQRDTWYHHAINRLGSHMTGFTTCVHPENCNLLCLFVMNEMGDIFLQTFRGLHYEDSNHEEFSQEYRNSKGKKMLQEWEENVIDVNMEGQCFSDYRSFDMHKHYVDLEKSFLEKAKGSEVKKVLWSVEQHVINTCLKTHENNVIDVKNYESLREGNSKRLTKYIPSNLLSRVEYALDGKCTDSLSSKLLSLWQEKKSGEPDFSYKLTPFHMHHVSCLPEKLKINSLDHMDESEDFDVNNHLFSHSVDLEYKNESVFIPFSTQNPNESCDRVFTTTDQLGKEKKRRKMADGF